MSKVVDRTGQRYGRLTVLAFDSIKRGNSGHTYAYWKCRCDCGKEIVINGSNLNGGTRSCGCLKKDANHARLYKGGFSKLYSVWKMMHDRCDKPDCKYYKNYGGRGIHVCDEWSGKDGYRNFRAWAESHGYADGLTLDRIDNDGDYKPENCRFATMREQSNNRRTNIVVEINGVKKTLTEWCREYNVPFSRVSVRYNKMGWSAEEALTTPRYKQRGVYNGRRSQN